MDAPKLGKIQGVKNHIGGSLASISRRVNYLFHLALRLNSQKFAQKITLAL